MASVRTTFDVIEVLHGSITTKTVDVETSSKGSMCGVDFTVGKTYVVYAGGSGSVLSASMCSRTHVLKANDEDVAFARAAKKSTATKAKVTGLVYLTNGRSPGPAGVEIRVKGTQIAAKSDAKGVFTFEIAPGTYELDVIAKGMRPWQGRPVNVTVANPAACARAEIGLSWDGQIHGRVTYADGTPASGVKVTAAARAGTQQGSRIEGVAGADGRYTLHEVPAGSWNVVVSPRDESHPSPSSPHPTTYYPGTPDEAKAKAVAMTRAGLVRSIDFVVPAPMPVVTITGDVKRSDGSPAAKAWITVIPTGANRSTGAAADEKGVLSIVELAGSEVVVRACAAENLGRCSQVTTKVEPAMKRLSITLPK